MTLWLTTTRYCLLLTLPFLSALTSFAQNAAAYQTPPKPLADLVTVPPTPGVSVTSRGDVLLILEQASAPTIAELAQPDCSSTTRPPPSLSAPFFSRQFTVSWQDRCSLAMMLLRSC